MKKLDELYTEFMASKGSEQFEFAKNNPDEVCRIIWYMDGMLQSYRKAYGL